MSLPVSRNIAIEKLWRRGEISWKLHRGQQVIDDLYTGTEGKLFVGLCARRFGKTVWSAAKAIECALKKPKARIKVASAFQKDVEEYLVPTFDLVMSDMPEAIKPTYLASKKKYKFKNGSEIAIVGLDKNPNGLRGNYCDLFIADEAAFISRLAYIYSSVVIPMTMYRPGARIIMLSTPAQTRDCDFYEFYQKAEQEGALVKLTIHDNPLVSPAMLEEYRKECLTEDDFRREYLCEWVTDTNLQIVPEWSEAHVFNAETPLRTPLFPHYRKYVSFDIGVVDKTAFLFAYYDWQSQQLVIEDEAELQFNAVTTANIAATLVGKTKDLEYGKPFRTVCDNNNLILVNDLNSDFQMSVLATKKDDLQAMVSELRIFVKDGRLKVSSRCHALINQLRNGLWDDKKKAFRRASGHHQDHLAALIYLVRNLAEYDNPVPTGLGASVYTHHIPDASESADRQTVQTLKQLFRTN